MNEIEVDVAVLQSGTGRANGSIYIGGHGEYHAHCGSFINSIYIEHQTIYFHTPVTLTLKEISRETGYDESNIIGWSVIQEYKDGGKLTPVEEYKNSH
jgi:hypothetical protein